MTKAKYFVSEQQHTLNGHTFTATRVTNDYYGNPRYVLHVNDLQAIFGEVPAAFKRYKANWYGGGYVIQSYSLLNDLEAMLERPNGYTLVKLARKEGNAVQIPYSLYFEDGYDAYSYRLFKNGSVVLFVSYDKYSREERTGLTILDIKAADSFPLEVYNEISLYYLN